MQNKIQQKTKHFFIATRRQQREEEKEGEEAKEGKGREAEIRLGVELELVLEQLGRGGRGDPCAGARREGAKVAGEVHGELHTEGGRPPHCADRGRRRGEYGGYWVHSIHLEIKIRYDQYIFGKDKYSILYSLCAFGEEK